MASKRKPTVIKKGDTRVLLDSIADYKASTSSINSRAIAITEKSGKTEELYFGSPGDRNKAVEELDRLFNVIDLGKV